LVACEIWGIEEIICDETEPLDILFGGRRLVNDAVHPTAIKRGDLRARNDEFSANHASIEGAMETLYAERDKVGDILACYTVAAEIECTATFAWNPESA
jgi:hypothetical protein